MLKALRMTATGLRLLCAVELPLCFEAAPQLLRLFRDEATKLYFTPEEALRAGPTALVDREAQSAWLVDERAPAAASVAALLTAATAAEFTAQLRLLGLDAACPVAVVRLVQECWTTALRERYLPCTLTLHEAPALDDLLERVAVGRAYFQAHGFEPGDVRLAHVFVDGSA